MALGNYVAGSQIGANKVLTTIAQGYTNNSFIGNYLFPLVETDELSGRRIEFDSSPFELYDDVRAPGSQYKEIQSGYVGKPYQLGLHGNIYRIPEEEMTQGATIGIDWGSMAVEKLMQAQALALENEQATLALDVNNYGSNNKVSLSGNDKWSDYSNSTPADDIRAYKAAIAGQIGQEPNVLVLGYEVFNALAEHPVMRDKLKYTSRDSLTPDMLGAVFGFEKVLIGTAIKNVTGVPTRVWGKDAVLAFTNPAALSGQRIGYQAGQAVTRFNPAYGYTYVYKGHPYMSNQWFDNDSSCYKVKITFNRSAEIVWSQSGFLVKGAVA